VTLFRAWFFMFGPIVAATTGFIRCLPGHSDGVIENVWSRKTLSTAVENYYIELKENYIRHYQFVCKMLGKWTIIILYDWIVGYFKQRHTERYAIGLVSKKLRSGPKCFSHPEFFINRSEKYHAELSTSASRYPLFWRCTATVYCPSRCQKLSCNYQD